jgi:hypothetical protein
VWTYAGLHKIDLIPLLFSVSLGWNACIDTSWNFVIRNISSKLIFEMSCKVGILIDDSN